jgi:hypothetical protein
MPTRRNWLSRLRAPAARRPRLTVVPLEDRVTPAGAAYHGHALAMTNQYVAVGASRDSSTVSLAGGVHLYDTATGNFLRTLANPNPNSLDFFGQAVAVRQNLVAVGAP